MLYDIQFIQTNDHAGGITLRLAMKLMLRNEDIFHSITIRRIYRECFKIDAGIGSYGWQNGLMDGPMKIGKYTSIGPNVRRLKVNHPTNLASTHPCYFNPIYGWIDKDFREYSYLDIGNDVWIGANAVILPSVHSIGNGAIIAAGSIVTKDVPPYEIWGGMPAKHIKKRFEDETGESLDKSEWWNLPEKELKSIVNDFRNPSVFLDSVNRIKANLKK